MIADRIKMLRETVGCTQSEIAKKLNVTRSSVNAWEMGISIPSTQMLVELAILFHTSTDYLLGLGSNCTLDITGLSDSEVKLTYALVTHFRNEEYHPESL